MFMFPAERRYMFLDPTSNNYFCSISGSCNSERIHKRGACQPAFHDGAQFAGVRSQDLDLCERCAGVNKLERPHVLECAQATLGGQEVEELPSVEGCCAQLCRESVAARVTQTSALEATAVSTPLLQAASSSSHDELQRNPSDPNRQGNTWSVP